MKFVIVGFGRVGGRTALVLREEGHEVVVIEDDPEKAERARNRGFEVVEGDGGTDPVLEDAGIADADAVGGLTGDPNVNFAACMLGAEHGCRTVMRIDEDYREEIYKQYAEEVDEIIYPERLGAAGAKTALLGGNFNALGDLTEQLQIVTLTVSEDAPIVGEHVNRIDVDGARIYAHGRAREAMTIPLPGTVVEPDDRLALLVERESFEDVRTRLLGASASAE